MLHASHSLEFIHFYNNDRPQRKLNKLTPVSTDASLQLRCFFNCLLNRVLTNPGVMVFFLLPK
ncbi:IS3 family transposase [Brevibacillus sp. NRS-1366]|uniref:IS3 family transposase n=1 Tax=Brevibacillus sp. NRS-1366 TaxID=3233899 RepID=UPI003D24F390